MNKVKVSKAISNVLDGYVGAFDVTLIDLVKRHCKKELRENEEVLYELNAIELSLAIVNGHEIELTNVEKWNLYVEDIKNEINYNDEIKNYDEVNRLQCELHAIKEMNEDFSLGLNI